MNLSKGQMLAIIERLANEDMENVLRFSDFMKTDEARDMFNEDERDFIRDVLFSIAVNKLNSYRR